MARNKMKNSKTVSFRLRNDICEELEKCSEETMLSKTAIVEKALEDYFKIKLNQSIRPLFIRWNINILIIRTCLF